jgi:hypothetical protein
VNIAKKQRNILESTKNYSDLKCLKQGKVSSYAFPCVPGVVMSFYFTVGPIAALGFFAAGSTGFLVAIMGDMLFWLCITNLHL